jgi:IS66 Orf2 like protein
MLTLPSSVRVYLAAEPIDLRRGHDGLVAIVRTAWRLDPFGGHRGDWPSGAMTFPSTCPSDTPNSARATERSRPRTRAPPMAIPEDGRCVR